VLLLLLLKGRWSIRAKGRKLKGRSSEAAATQERSANTGTGGSQFVVNRHNISSSRVAGNMQTGREIKQG
jgi:hypothetical protein